MVSHFMSRVTNAYQGPVRRIAEPAVDGARNRMHGEHMRRCVFVEIG